MLTQKDFWDAEAERFDSIYSHRKNRFAVLLDRLFRWAMYQRFKYAIEQSEPISEKSFLDVGCGTGLYSLEFARRKAIKVVGIDVSPKMINICRRRAQEEKLSDSTEFILTDILEYNPDRTFDICVGMGLLDYIKNPLPVLTKMGEITTEKVMLSFPVLYSWRTIPRMIRLGLKRCPVYFYTKRDIHRLIAKAGFKTLTIKQMGPMYFVIAS